MTQTLNPVITVTVSGPVGSGKSYVLARIEEVVKQEFGNSVIVDAADVDGEARCTACHHCGTDDSLRSGAAHEGAT